MLTLPSPHFSFHTASVSTLSHQPLSLPCPLGRCPFQDDSTHLHLFPRIFIPSSFFIRMTITIAVKEELLNTIRFIPDEVYRYLRQCPYFFVSHPSLLSLLSFSSLLVGWPYSRLLILLPFSIIAFLTSKGPDIWKRTLATILSYCLFPVRIDTDLVFEPLPTSSFTILVRKRRHGGCYSLCRMPLNYFFFLVLVDGCAQRQTCPLTPTPFCFISSASSFFFFDSYHCIL